MRDDLRTPLHAAASGDAAAAPWSELSRARWRDLPTLLAMADGAAAQGHFNPVRHGWRYRLGLALQLLGVPLSGRLLQGGLRSPRATLWVLRDEAARPTGMVLLSALPAGTAGQRKPRGSADRPEFKLSLLAVQQQGQGHGRKLLETVLATLPAAARVWADVAPRATAMAHLLARLGFHCVAIEESGLQRWRRDSGDGAAQPKSTPRVRRRLRRI